MNGFSVVLKLAGWIVAGQLGHRCYDRWGQMEQHIYVCIYVCMYLWMYVCEK